MNKKDLDQIRKIIQEELEKQPRVYPPIIINPQTPPPNYPSFPNPNPPNYTTPIVTC